MTRADLTLQGSHLDALASTLLRADRMEHAAYVLYGVSHIGSDPFTQEPRIRLMVREVIPVTEDEITSSGFDHISWKTDKFVKLLARAEREGVQVGIAHSHPGGPTHFSDQDDANEAELARLAFNRNGTGALTASLLFCGDGSVLGRVWSSPDTFDDFTTISTIGPRWKRFSRRASDELDQAFDRQSLALGQEFTAIMRSLRFGVVGGGGTGSPILQQLPRMGAGFIGVFDPDTVEDTNLNRLYGATRADADDHRKKIEVARREISEMALGTRLETFDGWVGTEQYQDALKSMDVIFGCTDDHDGRALLNRLAYYYHIPVIDLGLALRVAEQDTERRLEAEGRVTILEPGSACLLCRRIVNPSIAAEEALRRNDPSEYERRKKEAYVRGEGNPAPAVISFTTSVATMAIEELIQRLTGFRGPDGSVSNRVRKFTRIEDVRPGAMLQPCRICGQSHIHGLGDTKPFLGRVG
ncbi:hypothetical protein WH87_10205 [Devosia epidermidihirudinis]|uniref:Thiamine biosynthesis protein ThiF n=1 Tax=Devosia epidermidihirudinis TaxID=1293439 RepID=A0A0F5QBA2_9HYPH|nr:ThiF family adenylyltransferase [Devosia epidermidihirudinis]KKC38001.1 hypothetical protein WH87_10205 [Devosia epidermidihirudinis]